MANLTCFLAARAVQAGWDIRKQGVAGGPRLCVYASEETHTWIQKAVDFAGLGTEGAISQAEAIARAFRGEPVEGPVAESFYKFASGHKGNDLEALACRVALQRPQTGADKVGLAVADDHDCEAHRQTARALNGPGTCRRGSTALPGRRRRAGGWRRATWRRAGSSTPR